MIAQVRTAITLFLVITKILKRVVTYTMYDRRLISQRLNQREIGPRVLELKRESEVQFLIGVTVFAVADGDGGFEVIRMMMIMIMIKIILIKIIIIIIIF